MQQESSIHDVLDAIRVFSGDVDDRFVKMDDRFAKMDDRFAKIEATMATKADLQRIVTKDYLDNKIADLHSDLVIRMRKEDEKVLAKVAEMIK